MNPRIAIIVVLGALFQSQMVFPDSFHLTITHPHSVSNGTSTVPRNWIPKPGLPFHVIDLSGSWVVR
jgi:hypothetical protein